MNKFFMLRRAWWLVASLLLVTIIKFSDTFDWLIGALVLLAFASFWAVYLFRAWLMLVVTAIYLMKIETIPDVVSYGLVVVSVLGVLMLWYDYLQSYRQTQQQRQLRQTELLAACQRPRVGAPTVLILTASDGFGHLTAARTWSTRLSDMNVVTVDMLALLPVWLARLWQSWEYLAVYVPEVHALLHCLALRSPRLVSHAIAGYLAKRLPVTENVCQVIATHPLGSIAARALLGRAHATVRGTLVCTDFFVNPHALDFSFHEVKLPRDLSEGRPAATLAERAVLWQELQLDLHLPATLVLTGGSGLLPFEKVFKLLSWLEVCGRDSGRQFVLVCGTNEGLYNQAKEQLDGVPNVRIVRFVADISKFFVHFDAVVCKAGGLTTAELLQAGTTRIAVWYAFRGQERANLAFLKSWGAVYVPSFFCTTLSSWLRATR